MSTYLVLEKHSQPQQCKLAYVAICTQKQLVTSFIVCTTPRHGKIFKNYSQIYTSKTKPYVAAIKAQAAIQWAQLCHGRWALQWAACQTRYEQQNNTTQDTTATYPVWIGKVI
eukprot:15358719-Ditylum_brightwellii.AAC.3